MKKLFTLILALAIGFGLKAQCPLTQAVDFTATDVHGTEVHLFDILDGGQYVLADFFFTTCGPCQLATPKIVESYYAMGCNMHDVFYMEIATGDSDAACLNWVDTYGVEYPTISGVGGGTTICSTYQIGAYPTVILIAPNRQIIIQDLWPINNAQTIITALEGQGLEQHDCNVVFDETLTFSMDTVMLPYCEMTYITIYNNTTEDATVTGICDELWMLGFINLETQEPFDCYWPTSFSIPQGGSVELGIICCVTGRNIVPDVVTVTSNLPDAQFVVMVDDTWSVDENKVSTTLFPNPANDFVTLNGENLGTVCIYNVLGQKVDEFEANGNELRINTTGYESGMYFVKTDETTLRFVVRH